jgi:hypothetical protein
MKSRSILNVALTTLAFGLGFMMNSNIEEIWSKGSVTSSADAAVVVTKNRHTYHAAPHVRVVRRSTIYVNVLPVGCPRVVVNGVGYWHCGGRYYGHYNGRYTVVYVN